MGLRRPMARLARCRRGALLPVERASIIVSSAFSWALRALGEGRPTSTVITNAWRGQPSAIGKSVWEMGAGDRLSGASPVPSERAASARSWACQAAPVEPLRFTTEETAALVEVFVPTVFSSVSQIARRVPGVVMEKLSSLPEGNAGLAGYLTCHPERFAVTRIGKVVVARRQREQTQISVHQAKEWLQALVQASPSCVACEPRPAESPSAPRRQERGGVTPAARSTVPQEVLQAIPAFLVPVEALLSSASSLPSAPDHLRAFLQRHRRFLRYVNPFSRGALTEKDGGDDAALWRRGYVSLHPLHGGLASPESRHCEGEAGSAPLPPAERFAEYQVQDYEWYRIARLFPTVNQEVPLTTEVMLAARALLPVNRSVLHVLYSAPHLFRVRVVEEPLAAGAHASSAVLTEREEGGAYPAAAAIGRTLALEESSLSVRCQFLLDPAFAVPVMETRETLLGMLEQVQGLCAAQTPQAQKPVERGRRRTLRRKLQYLTNVTPFFDDRVLAAQLLDLMPADSAVGVADLVPLLSEEARNCLPGHLRSFFARFPEYFTLFYDGVSTGVQVQRADLPPPALRSVESIDAHEVLQEVFKRYPFRFPPECGTCLLHCLSSLPPPHSKRLLQLYDVQDEVLRPFPEKVEILSEAAAMNGLLTDPKKARDMLQEARGRRDLLVPFRFVGEWQDRLARAYEKHCRKHHHSFASHCLRRE